MFSMNGNNAAAEVGSIKHTSPHVSSGVGRANSNEVRAIRARLSFLYMNFKPNVVLLLIIASICDCCQINARPKSQRTKKRKKNHSLFWDAL